MRAASALMAFLFIVCSSPTEDRSAASEGKRRIEHRVTYTKKGTRSEARHGHLWIDGNELPDLFTLVRCGDRAYRFFQRSNLWGRDGYFPADGSSSAVTIGESGSKITEYDLKRGWYKGKKRLSSTPLCWLYVEWRQGSAFVSPDRVDDMARALDIRAIPRLKNPPFRTMN